MRSSSPSRTRTSRLLQVAPPAGGAPIAVTLRRNPRARRLVLTVDPGQPQPALVIPPFVSIGEAQLFLDSRAHWLERRLKALPPRMAFADGVTIPFLGGALTLRHGGLRRGTAARNGEELYVYGDERHFTRRATDWLKQQARAEFAVRAAEKAALLGASAPKVAVRDPKRQWGSCSARGNLRMSWRLILAPCEVIDYVIAHEVAHLREMNHSHRFWALVVQLTPHMTAARLWLRRNGHSLLRYG